MAWIIKTVMATNLAVIILQLCVLGFQIYRWNEIIGAVFGIVVSLLGYVPAGLGESKERWFLSLYAFLLVADLVFQLVNMILLICFQWVVIQYCIHLNVSVDISEYGGVACNDWWHFGYGQINYRDRSLIVTILLALVIVLRLIQLILTLASFKGRTPRPIYFVNQDLSYNGRLQRRSELPSQA